VEAVERNFGKEYDEAVNHAAECFEELLKSGFIESIGRHHIKEKCVIVCCHEKV
jgi:hypothetical protein